MMPRPFPGPFPPMMGAYMKPKLPKPLPCTVPSSTLYLSHLNERVKPKILRQAIRTLYAPFGDIVKVVVRHDRRMRGQAFVVFKDVATATKALEATQARTMLLDKPLMVQYARTETDVTVRRRAERGEDGTSVEGQDPAAEAVSETDPAHVQAVLQEHRTRRQAASQEHKAHRDEALRLLTSTMAAQASHAAAIAAAAANPDPLANPSPAPPPPPPFITPATVPAHLAEHLFPGLPTHPPASLPHKILFLQGLPAEVTEADLKAAFETYAGFQEVRLVPGKSDIAFVEYETEEQAVSAKSAFGEDPKINGHTFRMDYAKR
ncbi:hypothetical protein IWQ60_003940 [Tieghemiomyces parasiticus]|uniref:RRM domain-containing protein n=1 Tax=Tieghemiomyces parasiticus TaxID=78921 RepID=A0A9W8AF97_9FUNG|nr:hypothetical protein IWQ60_003940 [Tieghemiomyces parasiticus]